MAVGLRFVADCTMKPVALVGQVRMTLVPDGKMASRVGSEHRANGHYESGPDEKFIDPHIRFLMAEPAARTDFLGLAASQLTQCWAGFSTWAVGIFNGRRAECLMAYTSSDSGTVMGPLARVGMVKVFSSES